MTLSEKLELRSRDIAGEKIKELLRIFPEVRAEEGKIDFDLLRRALGEADEVGKERYGIKWPGKADCFKTIQSPSLGTLRPCPQESVNFDTTQNLIIEGDNLEVLKLLQKSYLGKVKMIYIDPPYNTGNDFIYPDNFTESLQTYLEFTGQVDTEGRKFGTNTDTDGRFHSKWLNMMLPRLYLARNLLADDGVIFVSIDDIEAHALRSLMNEIFGEENFIEAIVWKKRYGGGAKEKYLVSIHEYILLYARDKSAIGEFFVPLSEESINKYYRLKDSHYEERGPYRTHPLESMKSFGERKNLVFPISGPDGTEIAPKRQWRWSRKRVEDAIKNDELEFVKDKEGRWAIYTKLYLKSKGATRQTKFFSLIDDVYTQHGTNEIVEIFGDAQVFAFPKPSKLISKLITLATSDDGGDIILDFFAGSGATAHAVLSLNQQDGGDRKFVLVQLPEPTNRKDYPTIAEITKERVRRVIKKLNEETADQLDLDEQQMKDRGFRVFKLDESNFHPWNANAPQGEVAVLQTQLEMHVEHIRDGRTDNDLLYELLLKSGYPLTTTVEKVSAAGKTFYSVADGLLLVCLEKELTHELIKAMAERKPERVVCLDEGFAGNDQLKTNAVQTMKAKGVTSFKTV